MKRKILLYIFVLLIGTLLFPISVCADNKEYVVEKAEFNVDLQENGNAVVTETWTVNFVEGDFTRFYKDIYRDVTPVERFSQIAVNYVKINGKDGVETDSIDRIDNHYYWEISDNMYTIHWFLGANDETVTYEIQYEIVGVVKATDDNKAVFCYRYVGENFEKEIGETIVVINAPEETDIEVKSRAADTSSINGGNVVLLNNNVSGILRHDILMGKDVFGELEYCSMDKIQYEYEVHDNSYSDDIYYDENVHSYDEMFYTEECGSKSFLECVLGLGIIGIIFLGIPVITIVIIVFAIVNGVKESREKKKLRGLLQDNPNYIKNAMEKYSNVHPLVFFKSNGRQALNYDYFVVTLLELCRKEIACITNGNLVISKKANELDGFERETVGLMLAHFNCEDCDDKYSFNLSYMKNVLDNKKIANKFFKELKKIHSHIYISKAFVNNADLRLLRRYFKMYSSQYRASEYEYFRIAERNHTIDYLTILGFLFVRNKVYSNNDTFRKLREIYDQVNDSSVFIGSSGVDSGCSSCTSCSSCSSCGGCGGGGAD